MRKTRFSNLAGATVVVAAGMLAAPMAVPAQYDYQLISDGATTPDQALGINDPGQVAAGPWIYSTKEGTLTAVAPAANGSASALGINDAGDITGSVFDEGAGTTVGLIRSKHGEDTTFSHPGDAFNYTQGRGINNKGVVAGIYLVASNVIRGFIYDPKSGVFTDIDAHLSPSRTFPHGINSKGEVVGEAWYSDGSADPCGTSVGQRVYSWLRTKKGAMIYFRVNGQQTRARGINDAGQVVGLVDTSGFVIDAPETSCETITVNASDLLVYPGATHTWPEGITNSGDIVGVFTVDGFASTSGFLATPQVP